MSSTSSELRTIFDGNQRSLDYLRYLFQFKELFFFLAWRDILVRYKQAVFGVAWALIRPVLNMLLFTLLFGYIARLPSENVDYPLFVLAGMLPWQLCSNALLDTGNSLLNNPNLISKVFFPRLILPLSQIIVHLVDCLIGLGLLLFLGLVRGALDFTTLWTLPLFLALSLAFCTGAGLWLSALTVQYRDFRFIIPFVVQFSMFISPVGYGSFVVPGTWKWLFFLNPLVGIIDGFRWALFGISYSDTPYSIAISCGVIFVILWSGLRYFRSVESTFADRI